MPPRDFLRLIFRDGRGWLCVAKIHRLNGQGFSQKFFRYPDEFETAIAYIEQSDSYGVDLYFCPHLLARPERKKEHALAGSVLWADLDECHPSNLGRYGEAKPTLVVQTSERRWQAYWFLSKVLAPPQIEELNHRIALAYKDVGCDQSGWDISQLLRLPTKNWKRVSDV